MPSDYWKRLDRDEDGRWEPDLVPNQKESRMATRKKDETALGQDKAVDQKEVQTPDHDTDVHDDSPKQDRDITADALASDSDRPPFTGIAGEAFPDRPEPIQSEQTETVVNETGTEYQQPKFVALRDERAVSISPFGWVGPEAIRVSNDDLADFKAFVASL